MNDSPTADEILRDIEFEIVQGALGQDDLGQALQAARRFHNQSRHELLAAEAGKRSRELAIRQFQINEMLLVLIQETAAKIRKLEIELRKVTGLMPEGQPGTRQSNVKTAARTAGEAVVRSPLDWNPDAASYAREAARVESKLEVETHIKPVRLPLIGPLLTRLRAFLHSLPAFYVRQLADQQMEINRTLGESVAQLNRLLAEREKEVEALGQQLAALQAQSNSDRSTDPG